LAQVDARRASQLRKGKPNMENFLTVILGGTIAAAIAQVMAYRYAKRRDQRDRLLKAYSQFVAASELQVHRLFGLLNDSKNFTEPHPSGRELFLQPRSLEMYIALAELRMLEKSDHMHSLVKAVLDAERSVPWPPDALTSSVDRLAAHLEAGATQIIAPAVENLVKAVRATYAEDLSTV
jgi:hypothetical protein